MLCVLPSFLSNSRAKEANSLKGADSSTLMLCPGHLFAPGRNKGLRIARREALYLPTFTRQQLLYPCSSKQPLKRQFS